MFKPVEEILFWSGIMKNHAEFQLTALSSKEQEAIRIAQYFKNAFTDIENRVKSLAKSDNPAETAELIVITTNLLINFINIKRVLVRRLLQCNIELNMTPTFINHMINEAMEFRRVLLLIQTKLPIDKVKENTHLYILWLPDAAGHAASIAADLDPTEAQFIKEAREFEKIFNNLYLKGKELGQMLERTGLTDGSLEELNCEIEKKMDMFICFLEKLEKLREQCRVLGIFKPLVPNHMIREEKYFLSRLKKL